MALLLDESISDVVSTVYSRDKVTVKPDWRQTKQLCPLRVIFNEITSAVEVFQCGEKVAGSI